MAHQYMPKIFHDHHKNPLAPPPTYLMYSPLINNKTFENVSVIFDEPLALANEIMLNIMQSFNMIFSKTNFEQTGVYFQFPFPETYLIFLRDFFQCIQVE